MAPKKRLPSTQSFSDIKELRHLPRKSFLEFLKKLQENPSLLQEHIASRNWIDSETFRRFNSVARIDKYELVEDAGTFSLESCDPGELCQLVCQEAPALTQLYLSAHKRSPCSLESPWRIIIGFDEFCPGSVLSPNQSKKTMCLYFNFLELGHATVVEAATWMCPIIIACEVEAQVEGGWSRIFADFLERLLFGPTGFLTAGVAISDGSECFTLFATLGVLMSDGDGLRKAFAWRGASSMRPCFRHSNVLKKDSGLLEHLEGWVEITHSEPSDFQVRTAMMFFDGVDKVEAAHRRAQARGITKTLFENICKSESMKFHPLALPWRLRLRDVDWFGCFAYDWVHTLLQDGPLHVELFEYLQQCKEAVWFPQVEQWLQLPWEFPKSFRRKGSQLWRIFSDWRSSRGGEHSKIHCSASELLGCYSLVRLLLELKVPNVPERAAAKDSFLLCCKLADICQSAKKRTMPMLEAANALEATHRAYMAKHIEVYGREFVRPKFHWMFDIADQFRRDAMVHDQLVVERLHLRVKRPAEIIDNTIRWERSVLAECLNHQMQDLQLLCGPSYMMDERVSRQAQFPNAIFCQNLRVMGMQLSVGDVLVWGDRAGKTVMCGQENDDFFVVLELWDKVEMLTASAAKYRTTGMRHCVVDALEVAMVCAWHHLNDDECLVVFH